MKHWQLQEAKARFSALVEACLKEGPQIVTRRGTATAVLVPFDEWERLRSRRPSLKELLLADAPRFDLPIPPRGSRRHRPPVDFG